jgi:phenylalanyl-tRNA synthetase alpha chain
MEDLKQQIQKLKNEFDASLARAQTNQDLENIRLTFLSRQGSIAELVNKLKDFSIEEKRIAGPLLNALKKETDESFNAKKDALLVVEHEQKIARTKYFDVTASVYNPLQGHLHLYTQTIEQLQDIFISMGFAIADGPEVETDYYNFKALNIPEDHPARDMHDTFWLNIPNMLMRTHTSTVQVHAMENNTLPLAVFAPGRTYRNEATDASHDFMFTQGEGLFIDKNVSVSQLLATAKTFLQAFFENKNINIRARPGYFPFVEPGIEIDATCPFCKTGCSICKKTTWIELLGSGLVHPNVLRCSGIDPEVYSGFAFGFGIERLMMVKHGITDIRLFHSSKIQFLDQF